MSSIRSNKTTRNERQVSGNAKRCRVSDSVCVCAHINVGHTQVCHDKHMPRITCGATHRTHTLLTPDCPRKRNTAHKQETFRYKTLRLHAAMSVQQTSAHNEMYSVHAFASRISVRWSHTSPRTRQCASSSQCTTHVYPIVSRTRVRTSSPPFTHAVLRALGSLAPPAAVPRRPVPRQAAETQPRPHLGSP